MLAAVETVPDWVSVVKDAGAIGVLILFVWLFVTNRLVSRSGCDKALADERRRGDEFKELAFGAIERIERAVEVAKRSP